MPRKSSPVRSVSINVRQFTIALVVLAIIITTPIAYSYFKNPNRKPISETVSEIIDDIKIKSIDENDQPLLVTIPILKTQIDLTLFRRNPQLFMYAGIAFFMLSLVIGITLYRSLRS